MFLTKKSLRKIIIMAVCYFLLGSVLIAASFLFADIGIEADFLVVLGGVTYCLGILFALWGWYAERKGRWVGLGNQLIRKELRPAAFLNEYETLMQTDDLLIKKPGREILQLVCVAYDLLGERENALTTADEMIAVASPKKKTYANLVKASLLYDAGEWEAAEKIFTEVGKQKPDLITRALADAIRQDDRAFAMGDYAAVEIYLLEQLRRANRKFDRLSPLLFHYRLGEIYEKTQAYEKALPHYRYCTENGGETHLKASAEEAVQRIEKGA